MLNLIAVIVNLSIVLLILSKVPKENMGLVNANTKLETNVLSPVTSTENSLNLIIASCILISLLLALKLNFSLNFSS